MGGKRGWEEIGIEREQGVRGNGGFERYRGQKEKSMKGKTCKTLTLKEEPKMLFNTSQQMSK